MATPFTPDKGEWQLSPRFSQVLVLLNSYRFWWILCIIWAAIEGWSARNSMNPDGMSYMDMASEAYRNGAQHLVSSYWSPGYPALISFALFVFRPSLHLEFSVVHLVNFVIFVVVLLTFTFFLRSWMASRRALNEANPLLIPFGFGTFLWFTSEFIGFGTVTPDLMVAGIVFLAAGVACRLATSGARWSGFVTLGAILGLGYYVKAALFPLGLLLIALVLTFPPRDTYSRIKVVAAGLSMLVVAAPWIVVMSSRAGHLSIGETGRLNYAWHVNGLQQYAGWTGDDSEYGRPEHPPRVLVEKPRLLEFAQPINGTYPLWYDPAYWYGGAKTRIHLKEQVVAFKTNVRVYLQAFTQMSSLLAGALVLCGFVLQARILPIVHKEYQWLLLWPILACVMYAAVHAEYRFLGAFFVLFWLSLYSLLWSKTIDSVRTAVAATVLCTLLLPGAAKLLGGSAATEINHQQIALALQSAGVSPGDRLASVGQSFENYYAHLAGTRIVAEFPDPNEFWRLSPTHMTQIKERLSAIGVKALVAIDRPVSASLDGWQEVAGSPRVSILPFVDLYR